MLFAELLMGLLLLPMAAAAVALACVEVLLSVVFLLLELIGAVFFSRVRQAPGRGKTPATPSRVLNLVRHKWFRRVGVCLCGLVVVGVIAAVLVNTFFFESSVRWMLEKGRANSGITVNFERAAGNLFTGRVELSNVDLERADDPTTEFKLHTGSIKIDLDILSMIFGPRTIESAVIESVRGEVRRVGEAESEGRFGRKRLLIRELAVKDAKIDWTNALRPGTQSPVNVNVQTLTSSNLRSQWLAFDLLFRTAGDGSINGNPFALVNRPHGAGHETVWRFTGLPAGVVAGYVGGPFALLDAGAVDVDATTIIDGSGSGYLDMNWSIVFRDVHASIPPDGGWQTTLAKPVATYINQHSTQLPVNFSFKLEEKRFSGGASAGAAGLWQAIADGAAEALAEKLGVARERFDDLKSRSLDRLRSILPASGASDGAR